MELNQSQTGQAKQDEDVQFERDKEALIEPLTATETEEPKDTAVEGNLPSKEDTLGNSDFPPLTESDKKPKLEDDGERIKDMNRRTSLGD